MSHTLRAVNACCTQTGGIALDAHACPSSRPPAQSLTHGGVASLAGLRVLAIEHRAVPCAVAAVAIVTTPRATPHSDVWVNCHRLLAICAALVGRYDGTAQQQHAEWRRQRAKCRHRASLTATASTNNGGNTSRRKLLDVFSCCLTPCCPYTRTIVIICASRGRQRGGLCGICGPRLSRLVIIIGAVNTRVSRCLRGLIILVAVPGVLA